MNEQWYNQVLDFWFDELTSDQWFGGGEELDRTITSRFGALHAEMSEWLPSRALSQGDTALAAIIVLDQFSRNIHRGTARAFSQDPLALALTHNALRIGFGRAWEESRKQFLYMPLMHSEALDDQELCVRLFAELGNANSLKFAREHRDVIARFGRFPHRNAALGRDTTPEEAEYLQNANRYGQ